eukprot:157159-Pyramimonas_sp.AAC.1
MPVLVRRSCRLGCEGCVDSLPHYLCCPRLLHLLSRHRPRAFLPPCPMARIGLGDEGQYDRLFSRADAH